MLNFFALLLLSGPGWVNCDAFPLSMCELYNFYFLYYTYVSFSSAVAELITIVPMYVCLRVYVSVCMCLLATDLLDHSARQLLDNS